MSDRPVSPARAAEDAAEASLRPQVLAEFIGQKASRENLRVFIHAAKARAEAMDHVLLHGPPGLGKTTLAQIVARELGVGFRATSGPVIQRAGDLAAILTNLQPRDVLFIDEIHRLQPAIEEVLYPGDGGFPARPHHRRGAGGAVGPDRPGALHAGGRHHPRRAAGHPAARPVRHPAAPGAVYPGGVGADRHPGRREAGPGPDPGGCGRDRPALPRHAPDRRAAVAPGARFRLGRGAKPGGPGRGRCRADPAGGRPAGPGRDGPPLPPP